MKDIKKVIQYTLENYKLNARPILAFSFMFLLSFLVLLVSPAPTYLSFGGVFLRIGSFSSLSFVDVVVLVLSYFLFMFVFSDAVTNINLLVKVKRTRSKLKSEIVKGARTYALRIFIIYTVAVLMNYALNLYLFETPAHSLLYPTFSLLLFLLVFFAPSAIVIDDQSILGSLVLSLRVVLSKWKLVAFWLFFGYFTLSAFEFLFLLILPSYASLVTLIFNSLILIPFLTMLQAEMYMEKYPLSP